MSKHVNIQAVNQKIFFSPRGRVNRLQFFSLTLFLTLAFVVVIGSLSFFKSNEIRGAFFILATLFFLIQLLFIKIQRLHDLDLSGWFILLFLIPLFNLIFALYLFVAPGTEQANRYGPKPNPRKKLYYLMVILSVILVVAALMVADHFYS